MRWRKCVKDFTRMCCFKCYGTEDYFEWMLLRRAASEVAFLSGCCHWRIAGAPSNGAEVKLPEKRSNSNFVQHASNLAIKLPTSTMTLTLVKRIHVRSAVRFRSHVQLPMSRRRTAQTPYHLLCCLTHHWHRAENFDMLWFETLESHFRSIPDKAQTLGWCLRLG
ncbi:hypothetical protein CB0940_07532 [Cercospora beticola]|uniref:Uncharacterized protein n=1 Tax=Cercospora beticola TaxID=122368 RepID=A0A2G5H8J3_CERBT|nr:hypothetical protein CB0940_07532 [Cercospora beticola]PIA88855.1 hypothetical protein CB0940_07532 [Cercospora beticola]